MNRRYFGLAFTPAVKSVQRRLGAHFAEDTLATCGAGTNELGQRERDFFAVCDTFLSAGLSETGWPCVQHCGGPQGFVRVLGDHTVGWCELAGNSQYVSAGNALSNNRVALIFVDFARRRWLKLLGHLSSFSAAERPDLAVRLALDSDPSPVKRYALVRVEGLDWNCPQAFAPRFTMEEEAMAVPRRADLAGHGLAKADLWSTP